MELAEHSRKETWWGCGQGRNYQTSMGETEEGNLGRYPRKDNRWNMERNYRMFRNETTGSENRGNIRSSRKNVLDVIKTAIHSFRKANLKCEKRKVPC